MSRETVPTYEQRERQYADADALVYCPDCETSHPATHTGDDYEADCPER